MTDSDPRLASLLTLFDHEAWRLHGLRSSEDLSLLGTANLERLRALAKERATELHHTASLDAGDRREISANLSLLDRLVERTNERKPMLPRLRVEHFRTGHEVSLFLGDTPGALGDDAWIDTHVTSIEKANHADWVTSRANSGWYWQVTVEAESEVLPRTRHLRFSTSEPRALHAAELQQLRDEVASQSPFSGIWGANAFRSWNPIWCLERALTIDAMRVDFTRWLGETTRR